MARITNADLVRLKHTVSLVRLCRSRGIALRPRPTGHDEWMGRCPFHSGKNSALVVIARKNLFHCTECRAGGGALDFVVKADGLDYRQAAEKLLAALPAIQLPAPRKGAECHAANP